MTTPIDELAGIKDGRTRLPWKIWNEVPHPDGMTIYDPDGFRGGRPTVVTWGEFEAARMECTMVPRSEIAARSTPVLASNVSECALCTHTRTAHLMGVACCDCSGFVPASNVSEGLLLDAGEFGHNLAVTGRESLGHYGTFDECPQRLCQRVRAALAHAVPEGRRYLPRPWPPKPDATEETGR